MPRGGRWLVVLAALALPFAPRMLTPARPLAAAPPPALPEAPTEASFAAAPEALKHLVSALQRGPASWLLIAAALSRELDAGAAPALRALEALHARRVPWAAPGCEPEALRLLGPADPLEAGLHPLSLGDVRGTLALSSAPGGRRFAFGARGGAWALTVSARGRELAAPRADSAAAVELAADLSWTVPGAGPTAARRWTGLLTTAPGRALRRDADGRLTGRVELAAHAHDGRGGELAIDLAAGGLRVRGTWPGADGSTEDVRTEGDALVVLARDPHGRAVREMKMPRGGGPLDVRALEMGPGGTPRAILTARLDAARDGEGVGTWTDLGTSPPRGGAFRLLSGQLLYVSDQLGRTLLESLL